MATSTIASTRQRARGAATSFGTTEPALVEYSDFMTQPDPEELRRLGHEVVDLLADYLAGVEDRPLFPDIEPARLDELFDEPVPAEPTPAEDVLREVQPQIKRQD